MILGKLPVDAQKNLARERDNLEWTLDQLKDSIVKEIHVIEANTFLHPEDHHWPTASFHAGAINRPENRKPPKCVSCKESHSATQCNTVTDQSNIVKRKKLCFNCLGHYRVSQYLSNGCCKYYKERHHTSLCQGTTNFQISNNSQKPPLEQSPAPPQTVINTALSHPQPTKICFFENSCCQVMASKYSAQVNIFLDEGNNVNLSCKVC